MNCDTGAICSHTPQCDHFCQSSETRKVKPYPAVPDDIEPVPETWQLIGSVMVGAVLVVLMVICLGLFFTGLWVWSLLI
jgi:hypothetical protein